MEHIQPGLIIPANQMVLAIQVIHSKQVTSTGAVSNESDPVWSFWPAKLPQTGQVIPINLAHNISVIGPVYLSVNKLITKLK
jgi:hypothetical protein